MCRSVERWNVLLISWWTALGFFWFSFLCWPALTLRTCRKNKHHPCLHLLLPSLGSSTSRETQASLSPATSALQSQLQGLIPGLLVTDQQGSEQSDSGVLCWGIWYYKVFQIRRVPIITNVLTSNKCTELAHCLNSTVCGEASAGSWRKLSSVILMGNRWSVTGGCSVISLNR